MDTITVPVRETPYQAMRRRTFELLEPGRDGDAASQTVDLVILGLIALNIVALVLESVASLSVRYGTFFRAFEAASVAVFTAEYLLRLWSATARPGHGHWLLLWVAEQWLSRGNGNAFNPEVFNITGILDRKTLEGRMRLFL